MAEVELRDADDEIVGTAELLAGRDIDGLGVGPAERSAVRQARSASRAPAWPSRAATEPRQRQLSFAAFGFDAPVAATSLTVRATLPPGEFALFGGAAVGADGTTQQLFGRTKTKYRQVYVDNEIRVLEDTAAMPRAFLVPRARVAPSLGTALTEMIHQPFQPDQEVILADDATTQPPRVWSLSGAGRARAHHHVLRRGRTSGSTPRPSADAWLVLSDTYYPGWVATVDGQPAAVLRGDVLFRVVPVPAGEHDVEFRFEPASVKLGLLISLAALVLVAVRPGPGGWRFSAVRPYNLSVGLAQRCAAVPGEQAAGVPPDHAPRPLARAGAALRGGRRAGRRHRRRRRR